MDAKEYFESVPLTVSRVRDIESDIKSSAAPRGVTLGAMVSLGTHSDRTASAAARVGRLRDEHGRLIPYVADAVAVVRGVRAGLGSKYADALAERYLRIPAASCKPTPYERLGARLGVTGRTASEHVHIALDWLDSVGIEYARGIGSGAGVECPSKIAAYN